MVGVRHSAPPRDQRAEGSASGTQPRWRRAAREPLVWILLIAAVSRCTWIGTYGLMSDESYYWDWSRRLSAGYYDHPPLIAWLIRSSTAVIGTTEYGVRFWWGVAATAVVGLAYWMGRQAGTQSGGLLCAGFFFAGPVFLATSGLATPDGLALFWWIATLAAFQQALRARSRWPWVWCGLCFGCGLESKYTVVFLLPSLFIALLCTRHGRSWLRRREPYLAAAVALAVFSPNIIWNATHGWVTMAFQLQHGQSQAQSGLSFWDQSLAYLTVQVGVAMPFNLAIYVLGTVAGFIVGLRRGDALLLALSLSAGGTFTFFLVVNGMYHWTLPAYVSAALCGGILGGYVIDGLGSRPAVRKTVIAAGALVVLAGVVVSFVSVGSLVARRPLMPYDADLVQEWIDATAPQHDLGQEVHNLLRTGPRTGPRRVLITAADYGTASLAAFYAPEHPRVYSQDHQYGLWGGIPFCPACTVFDVTQ